MRRTNKQLGKIKEVLEFAWNNPYSSFYKDKYKKAGVKSIKSIKTWEDFDKLLYLTRDEIVEAGPNKFFFFPRNKINEIGFSSGTTNQDFPLILFQSRYQNKVLKLRHQRYFDLKIKSNLMLFPILPGQLRFRLQDFMWKNGTTNALGDTNNLELSAKIAARLEIDAIQTTPTILYYFTDFLKKTYDLGKIKLIYIAGEFCSKQKEQYFKENFKNAYIEFGYGGMETRGRGYRCKFMRLKPSSLFHRLRDSYYYETINTLGQEELVLTSLVKEGAAVIRYKTGDAVKLYEEECQCGENQSIEVFGRLESDSLKIQGTIIYAEFIHEALLPFSRTLASLDWKLHVWEEEINSKLLPKLELHLSPQKKFRNQKFKEEIARIISENLFLSSKMTLASLVNEGIFLPLKIRFVKSFPLEQKRKNIVSHLS